MIENKLDLKSYLKNICNIMANEKLNAPARR